MEDLSAVSLSPSLSLCAPASVSEVSDDADPLSVSGIACAWIDVYENWTVIAFALEIWGAGGEDISTQSIIFKQCILRRLSTYGKINRK